MMTAPRPGSPKGVRFNCVEVREYPRILGDNPSVSAGPPITLDWKHDQRGSLSLPLDDWEKARENDRRTKQEIRVPDFVREEWLIDAGFSGFDLQRTVKDIEEAKKARMSSITKSDFRDKTDVIAENVKRKFGRVLMRRPRSDTLYQQWKEKGDKTLKREASRRRGTM
mmetsp:Transcript_17104/g.25780  ORF Transcript_17104/g.25780 Transcript_17104/m.25780 type:complete len:168 (+) Transcript_17104:269-772(+)|eukprot:scaffold14179_cov155-Skeletonema_dohrnii-CCMP3373.AAC.2